MHQQKGISRVQSCSAIEICSENKASGMYTVAYETSFQAMKHSHSTTGIPHAHNAPICIFWLHARTLARGRPTNPSDRLLPACPALGVDAAGMLDCSCVESTAAATR